MINEVESDDPAPGPDWIELYNDGAASVNISGYVLKDSNDGNSFTIPSGTTIGAGAFYVDDSLPFALGASDAARLFAPGDLVNPIDGYSWTSHAPKTYGRCPDGTGPFTYTTASTKGAANACPVPAEQWPGATTIQTADGLNVFGENLSGLIYQPSGSTTPGVLWAVRNNPSTLYRLVRSGGLWVPDTANGWGAGKTLRYADGSGVPDAEDLTLAADDPNGVFVSTERDDDGPHSNLSRPAVLRFDVTGGGADLNATKDWNLTPDLPGLDPNLGLEAIAWVPDDVLVGKGFVDANTGVAYSPATYPGHGAGLFFVGVEQNGQIIAYALNQSNGTFTRITTIASGFPAIMALQFDPATKLLWAVCDNTCDGRHATLDVAQQGPSDGHFVVTHTYARPSGMPDLNNEGFAIGPQAECLNNLKPVFWADDTNDGQHALRTGSISCTVVSPPPTTAPLTVQRSGSGSGTVSSAPSGISCGSTCSFSFARGTAVTLSAKAAPGSKFAGWSGASCSGTGGCRVTLSAPTTIAATFTKSKPNTKLTGAAFNKRTHTATFKFKATGSATRFQCALVKARVAHKKGGQKSTPAKPSFSRCRSPKAYKHLHGRYTFMVRAAGPGGTDPSPATKKFRV